MVRHAGAAPAPAVWKTAVLAVTPMTRIKMVAASGIAPDSPRLQRGANLSQLRSRGPSARTARAVALNTGRGAQNAGRWSDNRAAVYRLSADCSAFELRRKMLCAEALYYNCERFSHSR